jgi:hypothetical protein
VLLLVVVLNFSYYILVKCLWWLFKAANM